MANAAKLLGRFATATPTTLFRLQGAVAVKLRLQDEQLALGRRLYDIVAKDGLVHPTPPSAATFGGPNGMGMKPSGALFAVHLAGFRGKVRIFEIPAGTPIPPELVLLHEYSDQHSMQPAKVMTAAELNSRLTAWLKKSPGVRVFSDRRTCYEAHPELLPENAGFSENA